MWEGRRGGPRWRTIPAVMLVIVLLASSIGLLQPAIHTSSERAVRTVFGTGVTNHGPPQPSETRDAQLEPSSGIIATPGSVIRTVFPGYNTSLPGSFVSSVSAWEVGTPAYVPSTDSIWFPQRSVPVAGIPAPSTSPAAVFNISRGQFDQLVTNLSNTSAFAYDPGNGVLYATQPYTDTVLAVNPRTGTPVGQPIPVGTDPTAIALDPESNDLFVANAGSSNLTVISALDDRVLYGSIAVGADPLALADDPQNGLIFVANGGSSTVSWMIATDPEVPQEAIPLYWGPAKGIAYSPATGNIVATIPSSGYATLISAASQAVITSTNVGVGVTAAQVSENGSTFILGNASGTNVVLVDSTMGKMINSNVPVGQGVTQLITNPASGEMLCWASEPRVLDSLNLTSNRVQSATTDTAPEIVSVAGSSAQSRVFGLSENESLVYDLDTTKLNEAGPVIPTTGNPVSGVVDYATNELYIGTTAGLDVFNASTGDLISTVSGLTQESSQLALDTSDGLLWLMNSVSGVSAVNLTTNRLAFSTGILTYTGCSVGIAVGPTDHAIFVLVSASKVAVLNSTNGHSLVSAINVGSNVTSIAFDPADGELYAAGDEISLINGSSFVVNAAPILLGGSHHVLGEVYDPTREDIYVSTSGLLPGEQGVVSVVEGASIGSSEGSVADIPVGEVPGSLGLVASLENSTFGSGMIWVANGGSGTISVLASPPEVTSFSASPSTVDLGFPTTIIVRSQGGGGPSRVSYSGLPPGCAESDSFEFNCTPTSAGTFRITANVSDSFGYYSNQSTLLTVSTSLGIRALLSPETLPYIDVGVALSGTASASNGSPPYDYTWSFSDGTFVSGPNASHTFGRAGIFEVTAEVRDATGATNSSSAVVVVVAKPSAAITYAPGNATDVNVPIEFEGVVAGGVDPEREVWAFGDGTTWSGENTSHAWTRAGNFSISLSSTDALGLTATTSVQIDVHPALTATFSQTGGADSQPVSPGTEVDFNASASGGTRPYLVTWSFDDGSYAVGPGVNHSYARPGSFTVTATLSDAVGASVTTNISVSVVANSTASAGLNSPGSGFGSGLFLGLIVGAVVAAAVLYAVGLRRGARPPSGPVSPYVPP